MITRAAHREATMTLKQIEAEIPMLQREQERESTGYAWGR
jgi:hypothetical protein